MVLLFSVSWYVVAGSRGSAKQIINNHDVVIITEGRNGGGKNVQRSGASYDLDEGGLQRNKRRNKKRHQEISQLLYLYRQ